MGAIRQLKRKQLKLKSKNRLKVLPNGPPPAPTTPVEPPQLKLDLGCGKHCKEGFEGVDISDKVGAKHVVNLLTFPWPWADGSVDEVSCSHFFEHIPGKMRFKWMDELYRVMKDGAKAVIVCPYYASMRAVQDPTHEWPPIAESSFYYFNKGWREAPQNELTHWEYDCVCDFDFGYAMLGTQMIASRNEETQRFMTAHNINTVADIVFTLTKRPPAPVQTNGGSEAVPVR